MTGVTSTRGQMFGAGGVPDWAVRVTVGEYLFRFGRD